MTYAGNREIYDADGHIMELPDWLPSFADDTIKKKLMPFWTESAGSTLRDALDSAQKGIAERRTDRAKREEAERNVIDGQKGWYAYGASDPTERSRALDQLGFKGQFIFPTFAAVHYAAFFKDPELLYGGIRAHNRAMAAFCENDDRMWGAASIFLHDIDRAMKELDEILNSKGLRTVNIPYDPPGGRRKGFSHAHKDLEPFWARLEEAGMPATFHLGGGRGLPVAFHNNGYKRPSDFLGGGENIRAKDYPAMHQGASNAVGCMILDGVLERHPKLMVGIIELGAAFVPGWLMNLDHAGTAFVKTEPMLKELSLKPSEYVKRQVRVTPFPFEDVGWLIEQAGEDVFLFSSDFPHPEGTRDPIGKFEESLDRHNISESARDKFYRTNTMDLMRM